MKYSKVITIVVFSLVLLSCKEKCEEYFLGSLLETNPLNGSESLIYINSDNDSLLFIGQGRFNTKTKNNNGNECYIVELDDCHFKEINNNYKIVISLAPNTDHSIAHMAIDLQDYTYSETWHYNAQSIFNLPMAVPNLAEGQFYIDSLLILDKYYYDIYASYTEIDKTANQKSKDTIHPSIFYYTTREGLIKVDFDDGSSWDLKEIIN